MRISGFMKQSFVDFPGKISAVIFTFGCNFNCWFCHNHDLISGEQKISYNLEDILEFLESRKGFLDGVVISGGEPTLQTDLIDVIKEIKSRGFEVKLDTNGSNPEVLKEALNFVDFVAMDIKTSLKNYSKIVGKKIEIEKIKESIELIKNSRIDYEFRTTFAPGISLEDVEGFAKMLGNVKRFAFQTYNPQADNWPIQLEENYTKAFEIIKKYIPNAYMR